MLDRCERTDLATVPKLSPPSPCVPPSWHDLASKGRVSTSLMSPHRTPPDRAAPEDRGIRWALPTGAPYRRENIKALVPPVWDGAKYDRTSSGILTRELTMLSRSQKATLRAIRNGSISKREVEIVVAHYDEDVAWMEMYEGLATYYCKGDELQLRYPQRPANCHSLRNVGREGHTFLNHIITNYDALADWTVFTQGQAPTAGYSGTEGDHANGHMYPGATFHDYVLGGGPFDAEGGDSYGGRFIFNGHWKPPVVGAEGWEKVRMAFAGNYNRDVDRVMERLNTTCVPLKGAEFDLYWGSSEVMLALLAFVDFLGEGRETKLYSQGARFALSRERIRQRPVEFYKTLLSLVNRAVFPISSAFLEFMWYYIPGRPNKGMPCRLEPPAACPEGFEQVGMYHDNTVAERINTRVSNTIEECGRQCGDKWSFCGEFEYNFALRVCAQLPPNATNARTQIGFWPGAVTCRKVASHAR
ncbi:unnamed protein product [Prorocentrum cordatum]|uniref:Phospholipase B-like n=1 Tax=Prorocentrum cordatum TaxID=2364126 RepID=A0ABN9X7C7_9DINO|nr:unnamed protein product [Polarella glacialis]